MNTTTSTTEKSTLVKIAEKLLQAQQELDELAVQLALGKAEAKDKFEEIKHEFAIRVNELKQMISTNSRSQEVTDLLARIETLDALLNVGKAETPDSFEVQKRKIIEAIGEIEDRIRHKFLTLVDANHFTNEFEKFKLKLEIIRLKFVVKKFEVKDGFRAGMKIAHKEITGIVEGTEHQFKKVRDKYDDFTEEISTTYKHLKKAVKKL